MKKYLLITAVVLMAAILLCGCNTKTAPEAPEYLYVTYNLDGEEFITLTKYMGRKTDVVVPTELDGLPVTEIGAGCFAETSVVSVTVPDSILVIESGAFSKCAALTSVTLPEEMLYLGSQVFAECTSLKEITLPSTVKRVDDSAFAGCANLVSVKLNEGLTTIGDYVFMSCTSLTEIVIPASVETLTESAFIRCNSLSKVMFEGNATAFKVEGATYAEEPTYTVYCHEGAKGFDADKWEGFTVELW